MFIISVLSDTDGILYLLPGQFLAVLICERVLRFLWLQYFCVYFLGCIFKKLRYNCDTLDNSVFCNNLIVIDQSILFHAIANFTLRAINALFNQMFVNY